MRAHRTTATAPAIRRPRRAQPTPRRAAAGVAISAALFFALVACAPSARTAGPYRAKARKAVEAVHSATATDRLLVLSVRRGHTLAPYISVATSDAEDDASSASSAFLSIQPPDDRSDRVRQRVSDLVDDALSVLGDVRVAGRRGDRQALVGLEPRLADVAKRLDDLRDELQ
jgi:hypothetical protein